MEEFDLGEASRSTIAYYDEQAEPFWEGTRDHDVSQNIAAILDAIRGQGLTGFLTSAAARVEISRPSRRWGMSLSDWKARPTSARWRAPTRGPPC